MPKLTGFIKVSLDTLFEEVGEEKTKELLSDFTCPHNKDVESFIKRKALEFEKQRISRTKLVYTSYKDSPVLVGYYTLTTKSFNITKSALSASTRKKITKFATYNSDIKAYILPAPLIGQLGKNFYNGYNNLISGDELLKMACDDIQLTQSIVGGKVVYLECEDKPFLLDFYSSNGFVEFDRRKLDKDETDIDGEVLVQMLRVFK